MKESGCLSPSYVVLGSSRNASPHLVGEKRCVTTLITAAKETTGVLTIYMGKPEIPVGKSNGSRHSVWEASENMGCDLR